MTTNCKMSIKSLRMDEPNCLFQEEGTIDLLKTMLTVAKNCPILRRHTTQKQNSRKTIR